MRKITLTKQALRKVFPSALMEYIDAMVQNAPALERAGILDTERRTRHFLTQGAAETDGFRIKEENGNYSAAGLRKTFPKYFKSLSMARAYAHKPQAIFNRTYANRMGNGPESSGDGWKYRGRGILQMTGKDSYKRYGDILGYDLVNNPDLASDPEISVKAAALYWTEKKLNAYADRDDLLAVSRGVNVGSPTKNVQPNGMAHRKSWYAKLTKGLSLGGRLAAEPVKLGLSEGDEGSDVKALQSRLRAKGYPVGAIDGIAGANTRRAIILFQNEHSTPDKDGIWRAEYDATLDASVPLQEARQDITASDLRAQGDKPVQALTFLQRLLYSLGLGGMFYGAAADQVPNLPSLVTTWQPLFEALAPLINFLSGYGTYVMCAFIILAAYLVGRVICRLVIAYRRFDYQGQFKPVGGAA